MGETTCLMQMQPFSYTAGIPNEAKEGNPINALGQSVSFGRFMSDSLAWEKWSTFSHNKYVEEAEKFSRPGSVAQKKAFFEAHYKNLAARKAAVLLEQAKAAANNVPQPEHEAGVHDNTTRDSQDSTNQESQIVATNSEVAADKEIDGKETNIKSSCVPNDNCYKIDILEGSKVEEVDPLCTEYNTLVENCVKVETLSQIGIADRKEVKEMETSETKQMEKPLLKDFICSEDDLTPISNKKSGFSSSKSLICRRTSKLPSSPAKPSASLRTKKENINTPMIKKSAVDSMDRKKTTPKSTHKSMNFTPVREINRITSTIIRKIDNSRVGANSKVSKDCPTPLRTPTTVSMHGGPRHPLATPQAENRWAKTPLHPSTSASKTVRPKWHFLPTDCSKLMSAARNKCQSPNLSLPFSFRTEERAARRKEKLEEKFNANQAKKVQLQGTLKEKAEAELKKLRQSLCFKARPMPDFYRERATSKNQTEKAPLTHSQSPPTTSMVQRASQLVRQSSKKNSSSKHVMGKNNPNPRSLVSRLKTINHENTSPNIQHEEAM